MPQLLRHASLGAVVLAKGNVLMLNDVIDLDRYKLADAELRERSKRTPDDGSCCSTAFFDPAR
jgi:hypothetical protein